MKKLNIKCFKNKESQHHPFPISLNDWLITDRFKKQILTLRNAPTKEAMDKLKLSLPCAMPSLLFDGNHSGFIAVDIDGINHGDNLEYTPVQLKEKVSGIVNVFYCGYSASGLGVWALIPLYDTNRHIEHFRALEVVFKNIGLVIDAGCSNVNRLRFCSYDSEPYINEDAVPFSLVLVSEPKLKFTVPDFVKSDNVFEKFNQTADVINLLTCHGWKVIKEKGDRIFFTRPDKQHGTSGEFSTSKRLFFCFTGSAQFEANKGYNAAQLLSILEYNNDMKLTFKELTKKNQK
ncbi:MAG: BT4734/BF3469 family protein [Paludibacter sp.]|nr:BT4734/BF3469 family protein [Paludibacter sp.]